MNELDEFEDVRELSEDLLSYIDLIEDAKVRNNNIDFVISKLQELKVKEE
mgnify:CR=1 FL=1